MRFMHAKCSNKLFRDYLPKHALYFLYALYFVYAFLATWVATDPMRVLFCIIKTFKY